MEQQPEMIDAAWIAATTTAGKAIIRIDCASTRVDDQFVRLPHVNYTLEIVSGGNTGHPAGGNRTFPLYHIKLDYTPTNPVKSAASLTYKFIGSVSSGEVESTSQLTGILIDWRVNRAPWNCKQELVITAPHHPRPTALVLAPLYGFTIGAMASRISDRNEGRGPVDLETAFERFNAFVHTAYRTWGLL